MTASELTGLRPKIKAAGKASPPLPQGQEQAVDQAGVDPVEQGVGQVVPGRLQPPYRVVEGVGDQQ